MGLRLYKFQDVVGNMGSVAVIQQSLQNGAFPHKVIFRGSSGTGKSSCAEIAGLYLTCDAPSAGEPCGVCPKCVANKRAIETTGRSNSLIKINFAQIDKKADMFELIKEAFVLQSTMDNIVYIFEEIHSLPKEMSEQMQTMLLEEFDRMAPNVYIMMCTTKPTKLLPELRNRAINFNFNRLSKAEASVLFERFCSSSSVVIGNPKVKDMILSYAKGVPREIVGLLTFITGNSFEEGTITDFLGIVDENTFLCLFEAMQSTSLFSMISAIEGIEDKRTIDVIIEQLKAFMLRVLFLMEGNVTDGFSKPEIERVRALYQDKDLTTICRLIETLNSDSTSEDLKFRLLKIRQLMCGSSVAGILVNDRKVAVAQSRVADSLASESRAIEQRAANDGGLTPLRFDSLAAFKGDTR